MRTIQQIPCDVEENERLHYMLEIHVIMDVFNLYD